MFSGLIPFLWPRMFHQVKKPNFLHVKDPGTQFEVYLIISLLYKPQKMGEKQQFKEGIKPVAPKCYIYAWKLKYYTYLKAPIKHLSIRGPIRVSNNGFLLILTFFSLGETFLVKEIGWALGTMHSKTNSPTVLYSLAHPSEHCTTVSKSNEAWKWKQENYTLCICIIKCFSRVQMVWLKWPL